MTLRVVFLGTPEFAVPSLRALARAGHDVVAVFTQPDRPKGRGNQVGESPVKSAARELGIPVHQPERIRRPEAVERLRELAAELMVVVGYGQIIPQAIIDLPRYGILNVHASLLPRLRGAAPIQWAIANGDTETGVTIMQIDAGLDTGDMLLKESVTIGEDETAAELSARLAPLGAELLIAAIRQIEDGSVRREKQNNEDATYAPVLKKEDGRIEWARTAREIYNRMRGFQPWPGAYSVFRGQQLSIWNARPVPDAQVDAQVDAKVVAGSLQVRRGSVLAGCGDGTALELLEVQPAGKKRMTAQAFVNGYRVADGETLDAAA